MTTALATTGGRKHEELTFNPLPHMREYLAEKEAEGRHPQQVRGIRLALVHFSDFVRPLGVATQYDIERHHLVRYQGWVNEQDWAKSYQIELLKRLRAWLNWLESVGYLDANPWVRIRVGRVTKKPNPLSDEDLDTLFEAHRREAFSTSPFTFHRREMMLCLLYGWGLRIHELVALDQRDLDLHLDYVRARNKGGGQKTLPYSPEMKAVFRRWSSARTRYADVSEDALLITNRGTRLDQDDVYRTITELGARCGVVINPHRLRDTCGTHLLDSDVPLERVSQILGHSNTNQTLAYSRVNNNKVRESHLKAMDPRLSKLFRNTRDIRQEGTE